LESSRGGGEIRRYPDMFHGGGGLCRCRYTKRIPGVRRKNGGGGGGGGGGVYGGDNFCRRL